MHQAELHPNQDNRQLLQRATRKAHELAEKRWTRGGSFDCKVSYVAWLAAMLDVHMGFCVAASTIPNFPFIEVEHRRQMALCQDLGLDLAPTTTVAFNDVSDSWAWGALYVLNGSAAGASILLKSGAIRSDWPRAYLEEMRCFAVSGDLQKFFQSLNKADLKSDAMVQGARDVFDALASQRS